MWQVIYCGWRALTPTVPAYLSLSPSHFETKSDDATERNVELFASVATAFAR
jgi:hypothetical protein